MVLVFSVLFEVWRYLEDEPMLFSLIVLNICLLDQVTELGIDCNDNGSCLYNVFELFVPVE